MRRIFAVATFAILGIVVLTLFLQRGPSFFEAQAQGRCIDPSGKYAFSADGELLQGNASHVGHVAWAGYMEFIKHDLKGGTIKGNDTVNYADTGKEDRAFTGTYTVDGNCAVTVNFSFPASASLYFADTGKEFRMVQRDLYRVASGSGTRVSPPDR